MTSSIETITPQIAKAYLETFSRNRRPRMQWVHDLTEMMNRGTFCLTHQGLAFDTAGQLFDGQHRLLAIIEHGKPVEMMVSRGVRQDAWKATDIGVKRSLADITGIHKRIAEPLRLAASLLNTTAKTQHADDVIALFESPLGHALVALFEETPTQIKYYSSSPMKLAAALWTVKAHSRYPAQQYAALVRQDYDKMSSCSKSLSKQVATQKTSSANVYESLARAYKVFDPARSGTIKLMLTGEDSRNYAAIYRQDIRAIVDV